MRLKCVLYAAAPRRPEPSALPPGHLHPGTEQKRRAVRISKSGMASEAEALDGGGGTVGAGAAAGGAVVAAAAAAAVP